MGKYNKMKKEVKMPLREVPLVNDEIYHVCNKSIAGFNIFNSGDKFQRMLSLIVFYNSEKPPCKFALYLTSKRL